MMKFTDTARPPSDTLVSQGQRRLYRISPFTVRLKSPPSVSVGEAPELMFASLLIAGPDSWGSGYRECPRTAANRRPVKLARRNSHTMFVPHALEFHLPGSALIDQLGLFDSDGTLLFHGELLSARQSLERPEHFRFDPGSVEVCC